MSRFSFYLCPFCHTHLEIDDIDYNFKGCYDEYVFCDKCKISGFLKIRYSNLISCYFTSYGCEKVIYNDFKKLIKSID